MKRIVAIAWMAALAAGGAGAAEFRVTPEMTDAQRQAAVARMGAGDRLLFARGVHRFRRRLQVDAGRRVTFAGEDGAVLCLHCNPAGDEAESCGAFLFTGCDGVTVRNLRVTTDNFIGNQGTVVGVDEAARTVLFRVDPEFPTTGREHYFQLNTVDAEGVPDNALQAFRHIQRVPGAKGAADRFAGLDYEVVAPQLVRIRVPEWASLGSVTNGHRMLVRYFRRGEPPFAITRCRDVTVEDVEIERTSCMGLLVSPRSHNLTLRRFNVRPPRGRYAASNSDAVHFLGLSGLFTMEDCHFRGLGDDALNVHSSAAEVKSIAADGTAQLIVRGPDRAVERRLLADWARAGDVLDVFGADYSRKGSVKLKAYDEGTNVATLPTDGARPAAGDLLVNTAFTPAVRIRNCSVEATRARAFALQTRDVRIENCLFRGFPSAALIFTFDFEVWNEAGPTENAVVTGCRFERCGSKIAGTALGGVVVKVNHGGDSENDRPAGIHRNVAFLGNTFSDCGASAIYVASTDGVEIDGNTFRGCSANPHLLPCNRCDVRIRNCTRVRIGKNATDRPDSFVLTAPEVIAGVTNRVVDGGGALRCWDGPDARVVVSNCQNVTLRGYRFYGKPGSDGKVPAIEVLDSGTVAIEGNAFERLPGPVVRVGATARDVTVRGNRIVDCLGRGGDGLVVVAPGARGVTVEWNRLEQFKATLIAARGAKGVVWRDNDVAWNGNRLALWGRLFEVHGCEGVRIDYDGPRIEESSFGGLTPPAVPASREYIWPEGVPSDIQPHQIAAKDCERKAPGFRREDWRRPYVDWYLPPKERRTGRCIVTVSGGGFSSCSDRARLAPSIDRFVRAGAVVADLTYRTPPPKGLPIHASAVQDLKQALKVVRGHAADYGFDPAKIGALGNSAGAKAIAVVAAEKDSCGLAFAVLQAPAFVLSDGARGMNAQGGDGPGVTMVPELAFQKGTCPMCLFQGGRDAFSPYSSIAIYESLARVGTAADLHLYGSRWHGFQGNAGRERGATGWDRWFDRVEEFLSEGRTPPTAHFGGRNSRERASFAAGRLRWHVPQPRVTDEIQIVLEEPATAAIARELVSSGLTVVTLPGTNGVRRSDIQRAIREVRAEAPLHGLNPERVGLLGAGRCGSLALFAATSSSRRTYNPTDAVDAHPPRLAWAVAIDPEGEDGGAYDRASCPVLFLATQSRKDRSEAVLSAWKRLQRMDVPCDLHIARGGDGAWACEQIDTFLNDLRQDRKASGGNGK